MPLPLSLLRSLQSCSPADAWAGLLDHIWNICTAPLAADKAPSDVARREAEVGAADLFMSAAGWDLWRSFEALAPHTADALAAWWMGRPPGRAVLILDALSLREAPWLLKGAADHGYTVQQARPTCAELPADTTSFAEALGFGTRGSLQNNGGANRGRLTGAKTDSTEMPWRDCAAQIDAAQDWLLWHHWPDARLHDLSGPGHGLAALSREAAQKLVGEDFWELVYRLTTGRRLIITSDHGYAATGGFPDISEPMQAQYLKDRFKGGRWARLAEIGQAAVGGWVPPLDLQMKTRHADVTFALGRRKWKSAGGYPTLTHGGLTLLEVAVPFIELSRPGGI